MKIRFLILVLIIITGLLTAQSNEIIDNSGIEQQDTLDVQLQQKPDSLSAISTELPDSLSTISTELPDSLSAISTELPDSLSVLSSETPDSLNIEAQYPDSLNFAFDPTDSLAFQSDSLFFSRSDSLLFPQNAAIDTLDLNKLHNDLQEFLRKQKQEQLNFKLPMIVEKEDFHWKTPFNPNIHFTKNGFTYIPYKTSNIHTIQNFIPMHKASYQQGFVDFSWDDYDLPVAFSEVYLGQGDIEMKHAAFNYKKGDVIGVPGINMEIGYVGMDGAWLGKREKSRNFASHLFYDHNWGKVHLYYLNFDQEISSNKLSNPPQTLSKIEDDLSEIALKWENPYLDIGFRRENSTVDSLHRHLSQWLISKQIEYKSHSLKASYEYLENSTEDKNFSVFNINHNSDFKLVDFSNRYYHQDKNVFFLASELKSNFVSNFNIGAFLEKGTEESVVYMTPENRYGGELFWKSSSINVILQSGEENIDNESNLFIESRLQTNFKIGILNILLNNWTIFRGKGIKFSNINPLLPKLQTQSDLELHLDMKHGNFIKLGVSNWFLSEYGYFHDNAESITYGSFVSLDAWLAIQITSQFQIKVDAVNLTNAETLYGLSANENLAGRHFNFNFHWIFIN